jgi:outer membrane immunogenic protein
MRLFNVLGAACACLVSTSAIAADLGGAPQKWKPGTRTTIDEPPPPPPPPGRPMLWQGIYYGLSGGYGWGESTQSYDRNDDHGLASTSPKGYLGSLTLGYNHLLGSNLLIGIEGDLGLMNISANDKEVYDGHIYRTSFGPWWSTVRGRAGLVLGPLLLYGTGGLAIAAVDEISIGNTPGETASNRDVRSGWVAGGGVEFAFSPNVSAKIEYLHMDFGTYNGISANREDFSFDNKIDVVRAGLNFRF